MKRCDKQIDMGRRWFLSGAGVAAAGAAAVAITPAARADTPAPVTVYPANRIGNLKDLKVDAPFQVNYPDADSPGVLLKLGREVTGGVGPDGDIVGFTTMCPHKGFPLAYSAADKTLNCPGHYSRFDCENGGQQVWGHATQNLPQFALRVDSKGDIYADGVDELIYGRLSNVLKG